MFSRIKSTIMAVAILSIIFLGQNAFAEDSGPFVWDFPSLRKSGSVWRYECRDADKRI